MSTFDLTLKPVPEASQQARRAAADFRFYESRAFPGMVSVVAYESQGSGFVGGTRLTRMQALALRDGLDDFLDATAPRFVVEVNGETTDRGPR